MVYFHVTVRALSKLFAGSSTSARKSLVTSTAMLTILPTDFIPFVETCDSIYYSIHYFLTFFWYSISDTSHETSFQAPRELCKLLRPAMTRLTTSIAFIFTWWRIGSISKVFIVFSLAFLRLVESPSIPPHHNRHHYRR